MAEGHDHGRPEIKLSQLMFMIGSWAVSHRISHCHKISNIRMQRSELLCLDLVEKKNSGIYLAQRSKGLWELLRQVGCVSVWRALSPALPRFRIWWRRRNRWPRCCRWASATTWGSQPPASDQELCWWPWNTAHIALWVSWVCVCVFLYVCVHTQFTADGDACSNAPWGQEPQAITLSDNHIPSFCLTCTTFRPDSHLELLAVAVFFFFFLSCLPFEPHDNWFFLNICYLWKILLYYYGRLSLVPTFNHETLSFKATTDKWTGSAGLLVLFGYPLQCLIILLPW